MPAPVQIESKEDKKEYERPDDYDTKIQDEIEDVFGDPEAIAARQKKAAKEASEENPLAEELSKKDNKDPLGTKAIAETEPDPEPEVEEDVEDPKPEVETPEEEGEEAAPDSEPGDGDSQGAEEDEEAPEEAAEKPDPAQARIAELETAHLKLLEKINSGAFIEPQAPIPAEIEKETPVQKAQAQTQIPSRMTAVPDLTISIDPITDEMFQEIQSDPRAFDNYMKDRDQRVVQSTRLQMVDTFNSMQTLRDQINEFAKSPENVDIKPLINIVVKEATRLDASMPEATVPEVLAAAGNAVRANYKDILTVTTAQRKEIHETKKAAAKQTAKPTVPRFARPTARREVAATPTEASQQEKEILETFGGTPDGENPRFNY